jgi:acyl carrier protein
VPRRRSGIVPSADQALAVLSAAAVDRFSGESRAIGSSTFDQTRDLRQDRASFMAELDLRARIKEMLIKSLMLQVTPEQIGDDLPLFGANGLGLDSIDALELVVSMEKTFGVGVPSAEVAGKALQTVNTIHDYILEKRSAAA